MLINVSESCSPSEQYIRRPVCQAPPAENSQILTRLIKSRRDAYIPTTFSTRTHLDETHHQVSHLVLLSRRVMCYNHTVLHNLDELCTTTTISTIHTATTTDRISTSTHTISTRIIHVMQAAMMHLHIVIMHDII
jgi:hypothetical protein